MRAASGLSIAVFFLVASLVQPEEWSRFRGPNGQGISTAIGSRPHRKSGSHVRRRPHLAGRAARRAALPLAFTRFRLPWRWDGKPATIASRATDETGYVQPTREELIAARGTNSGYHFNGIKLWNISADGSVANADV
jgi:hypothetical protein